MKTFTFTDTYGSFSLQQPQQLQGLYFPIASEKGIKSVVTPNLAGDSKINQNTFLLEPESIENLHNNRSGRNFWCVKEGMAPWSAVGHSPEAEMEIYGEQEETKITAGYMWHTLERTSKRMELSSKVTSFVPYDENVELMVVTITNNASETAEVTTFGAIPLYGRSADNIRDHRHVTSLLHRIRVTEDGVIVKPTLSFDERGHQKNHISYFVCGIDHTGAKPVCFYPSVEEYLGEAGTYTNPEAVARNTDGVSAGYTVDGYEAVGAMKFQSVSIAPNGSVTYTMILGATTEESEIVEVLEKYRSFSAVKQSKEDTFNYWKEKVNVAFHTGNEEFDGYMRWVCFQPFLRRVYGCSFLPHHDYGKGGRGWRDLWQDCLALLIMDPKDVGTMIQWNFAGVRMDGSNATIIGNGQGEFVADRNGITRVWMDHGMWPFLTTQLYIDQTGDQEILLKKVVYFKDRQVERGRAIDTLWEENMGNIQLTKDGDKYEGTVLEHLILQHICAILEIGEHGKILLRGADWNDAIDMATHRGESVAFTCAYAGNLLQLAKYIRSLSDKTGEKEGELLSELVELLSGIQGASKEQRQDKFTEFQKKVRHTVEGTKVKVSYEWLAGILETEGAGIMNKIRKEEWITDESGNGWFNSYYDDNGRAVEGVFGDNVRMMLTGQVFAIMSGTANEDQVVSITKSADQYLYEKEIGGYRLNTNFHEEKYDMGRMFGFAYGEKENGAVFSHMTVMYANALYQRGFVRAGYKALQTLADAALHYEKSRIFPGVPEYFNSKGRGLYHYLTGAASWYELTMVTQVFGVRGEMGALCLEPKLVPEQFDQDGKATISLMFQGKQLQVTYCNTQKKEEYSIASVVCNGKSIGQIAGKKCVIPQADFMSQDQVVELQVELG